MYEPEHGKQDASNQISRVDSCFCIVFLLFLKTANVLSINNFYIRVQYVLDSYLGFC